jgi:hypothetical protein
VAPLLRSPYEASNPVAMEGLAANKATVPMLSSLLSIFTPPVLLYTLRITTLRMSAMGGKQMGWMAPAPGI